VIVVPSLRSILANSLPILGFPENGHTCYFQELWKELSTAGLSLDTR
jgi:hypothetical protein